MADADFNAPLQLKDLVARRASSEGAKNPAITKIDVLRALDTDEGHLFPAPCLIAQVDDVVPREQEHEVIKQIISAGVDPVIVHAAAGVGKSVLSTRIRSGLPEGSIAIVYDCFGNGAYRSASGYRHRHEDALVQIANELAAKSLCHLLIPTSKAKPSDYARTFLARLKQSIASIGAHHNDALLCIIIDAADNAQMAADELCEPHSFVRDLIREQVPAGVRLVLLCRTHRQELLNPPPQAHPIELQPFSRTESALHLRHAFPDATEHDVNEFHPLSSRNPRVQAIALSLHLSLADTLRELGPSPTNVDAAINNLLDKAMARVLDSVSSLEKKHLAHDELKEALMQSRGGTRSEQTSDFESNIGALLPWHNLWANTLTGYLSGEAFQAALKDALSASAKESSGYYRERPEASNKIALVWLESLLEAREDNALSIAALPNWIASLRHPLFTTTLTRLARLCARSGLAALALKYTEPTLEITKELVTKTWIDGQRYWIWQMLRPPLTLQPLKQPIDSHSVRS